MEVYILNVEYEIIGVIDEAESILWNKKYNDIGECEIYIPCTEHYLTILQKGNYVFRYDDDMCCKIETVEIKTDVENGDYIIATARDVCSILSGRIIRWQTVFSGTVAKFFYKLLNDNVINPTQEERRIPNFTFDELSYETKTDSIDVSVFTEDLLQLIMRTCKSHNYGFRVALDVEQRQLVFRLYAGKNKATADSEEYIEFSPQFANILTSSYKEDESNYKNVAYVGYTGLDDKTYLLSLFKGETEPQGENRREIYVDGTGTSRNITYDELLQVFPNVQKTSQNLEEKVVSEYFIIKGGSQIIVATSEGEGTEEQITISDYTYLLLIRELGTNALYTHVATKEYNGAVDTTDTYEYKTDYNLGDTVKVINEYGIEGEAQITEVMESDDMENGYVVEPIFEYLI